MCYVTSKFMFLFFSFDYQIRKLHLYLEDGESLFYVPLLTQESTPNPKASLNSYRQHK